MPAPATHIPDDYVLDYKIFLKHAKVPNLS